ncbi:MerR family transcriptional regulator [Brachybacterium hainanense]|uniref:MerR family transcriptional regulator n=1 Tax=Brachybacterium hainanense TaxID=1541174 RepID=A0ABV6RC89_9MICO
MESMDGGPEMLHIGAVAERTGMSLRTLRHYDDVGLVSPSARSEGGFRLYTEPDVQRILLIRRMKPLGYSLQQMRELLEVTGAMAIPGASETARDRLAEISREAALRREQLGRQVAMADEFLARLEQLAAPAEGPRPGA